MTLEHFTNLEVRDKLSTLNNLYKREVKFEYDNVVEDMMDNLGMNK